MSSYAIQVLKTMTLVRYFPTKLPKPMRSSKLFRKNQQLTVWPLAVQVCDEAQVAIRLCVCVCVCVCVCARHIPLALHFRKAPSLDIMTRSVLIAFVLF